MSDYLNRVFLCAEKDKSPKRADFLGMTKMLRAASVDNLTSSHWHIATQKIIQSKFPTNPTVNFEYVKCLTYIGQTEKADEYLNVAIKNIDEETRPEVLLTQIIGFLWTQGRKEYAIKLCNLGRIQFPEDKVLMRYMHRLTRRNPHARHTHST